MDISDIRKEIDAIDKELLDCFLRRMECSKKVAEYKSEHNIPVLNAQREEDVLQKICKAAGEHGAAARLVYASILEVSRALQHNLLNRGEALRNSLVNALSRPVKANPVIACQGVLGAYSGEAAEFMFPGAKIIFHETFEDVFKAVNNNTADFGVVPVENSTAGSVAEVYDLMLAYRFFINKGLNMRISHCFLGKGGAKLSEIKQAYSHPQGLRQCSKFLEEQGITPIPYSNTAAAASKVAAGDDFSAGAIASNYAAQCYGLEVLSQKIENSGTNSTRFISFSKALTVSQNAERISLVFSVPHSTGSLYGILARFAAVGLNLTKIESRPVSGRDFEYIFYLDFTGSIKDEKTRNLICNLSEELPDFSFLGNYLQDEVL